MVHSNKKSCVCLISVHGDALVDDGALTIKSSYSSKQAAKGLVLMAVLVTISLLTLLLMGTIADLTLTMRSNSAYAKANEARRQCEQWAVNLRLSAHDPTIKYTERLLNTQPCAMVLPETGSGFYPVTFSVVRFALTDPQVGLCEVVIATVDKQVPCLKPVLTLKPGMQTWRWLPLAA